MLAISFDDPDLTPIDALRSRACSPVADDLPITAPLEETVLRGGPLRPLALSRTLCGHERGLSVAARRVATALRPRTR